MDLDTSPSAQTELIRYSVDVITVLDKSGTILYESPSLRRMFGYEPTELVGENVFDYIHPDDRQDARETFREVVEASTGYTSGGLPLRFRHKDGGWVCVESRGANEVGSEIGGYVVTTRDITEQKEYERQLERERDRLERVASFVSHDLRNPLTVAEGRLELAQEECRSEHLDAVARSHDRMHALIEDMLALTRKSGADPQRDAIDLRRTVETCWRHVDTNAATLTVETDRSILADEGQVRQLLENLVRNAVEHGGDAVTVTVGNLSDGFFVEDDGRGIPEEDRERSLDYGFSTRPDGTGLGLSIVREVVDNHGWCLTVTDGREGGARFEVSGVSFV